MKLKVSILGCGWLGFPLAKTLMSSGIRVSGSTTTPAKVNVLKQSGISPFLIDLSQRKVLDQEFFYSDILFINTPFRRDFQNPQEYVQQLRTLLPYIHESPIQRVIFVSSTSIYPQDMLEAREDIEFIPDNDRSKALLAAEQLFHQKCSKEGMILRLAGLCGYDRQIGKFLSGKSGIKDGSAPVNLVHRDDVVAIIQELIRRGIKGGIYNICCDGHPTKKELYIRASQKLGLVPPRFENEGSGGKIVSNDKIKFVLNYQFQYPHPMDFGS